MKVLKVFLIACVVVLSTFAFSACGSEKVKWSEWECIIASTCTSEGIEARTNNKGKTEMRAIAVDATAHTSCYCWITVVTPTCEEAGQESRICMDCGDTEARQISATGHSWSDWFVKTDATCDTAGVQKRICIDCANIDMQTNPATGHTWSNWSVVTAPSCDENGEEERLCEDCGGKETNQIPAAGHSWGNWLVAFASTCDENGEEERVCEDCGGKETNQIHAAGHSWEDWSTIKPATCTKSGKEKRVCLTCQEKEIAVIPSLGGHEWNNWQVTIPATCKKVGKESRTCIACNKTENRFIPPLGHNYILNQVAPTCETNGYDKYTCANCENSYKRNKMNAIGHDWSDWNIVSHPTRDTDGFEQRICNNCGGTETIILPSIIKKLTAAAEEFIAAIQNDVSALGNSSTFYLNPANYTDLDITSKSTSLVTNGNGSTSIVNDLIKLSNFNDQSTAALKLTVVLMLEGVKCEVAIDLGIGYASESGGYNWAFVQSSCEILE